MSFFHGVFPAKMFSRVNSAFSTFGAGSLLNKLLLESAVSFEQPAVQTIERKENCVLFFLNKLFCAVKLGKIDCFLLEPWFMNIVNDERRINWFWSHQTDFKMLNLISFYRALSSHDQADGRLKDSRRFKIPKCEKLSMTSRLNKIKNLTFAPQKRKWDVRWTWTNAKRTLFLVYVCRATVFLTLECFLNETR